MKTLNGRRWLIITACLFSAACTEKTIINEAMPSSDVDEQTLSDATNNTTIELEASNTNSVQNNTNTQIQGIPGAPEPVITTPVANMVSSPTTIGSQTSTTPNGAQTTPQPELTIEPIDSPVDEVLTDIPNTEPSTTNNETVDTENPAVAGEAANENNTESSTLDESPLLADPITPGITETESSIEDDSLLADSTTPTTPTTPTTIVPDTTSGTTKEPAVTGTPGSNVDCQMLLPCRWLSADTQFSVTVTNADNIGEQGRLGIEYTVLTSHDTEVNIAGTDPATDEFGVNFSPAALRLGEVTGAQRQGVSAGSAIHAFIEFDKAATASSLNSWSIALSDAGLIRQPAFNSIPVGTITKQHADCAYSLPCAWASPSNDVTITLLSASSLGSSNRLTANFRVETTRNTVVAVDTGSTATGTDGMNYEGRTHAIGVDTGAQKLTDTVVPGTQLTGSVFFFRTQDMSAALQQLSLIVYEDKPTPRWNPSFLAVPIQ